MKQQEEETEVEMILSSIKPNDLLVRPNFLSKNQKGQFLNHFFSLTIMYRHSYSEILPDLTSSFLQFLKKEIKHSRPQFYEKSRLKLYFNISKFKLYRKLQVNTVASRLIFVIMSSATDPSDLNFLFE